MDKIKHVKTFKDYLNHKFYNWFGKSTLVDDNGNPNIYYHGVGRYGKFEIFEKDLIGITSGNMGHYGKGFYFSDRKNSAINFSKMYGGTGEIIEVYLKLENPFIVSTNSLIKLGEKYNLNLPKKVPVALNLNNILKELYKIDKIASELLNLLMNNEYSKGWELFIKNNNNNIPESTIDLNDVSEWVEYNDVESNMELPYWLMNNINELNINNAFIYGYSDVIKMEYLTNLGQDVEEWTSAIKKENYDGVIAGDEYVVFESNQIKSATNNNGNFDINNSNINESFR